MSDQEQDFDIMQLFHQAEQEVMQKATGLSDWTYKDLPRMSSELMVEFKFVVGEDNLHWITFAEYPGRVCRGQVMISPDGINRIKNYQTDRG